MTPIAAVRTRFPPSPTGWLHVGNARTALFNYLFSQRYKGMLILRIEDTDRERSRKEFEDDIIEQLSWLGITWDEFHRQSDRMPIHKTYLEKLLKEGKAFYCAHTKEELEAEHTQQVDQKEAPRHICGHRNERREQGIIRLRNDKKGVLIFKDIIRGDISFDADILGDVSIARDLESPLYNFVVVIDDAEMQITHIIRGEDHISNTPKQLLIQQAFQIEAPLYAHVPLLLGTDRSKLSKRHGDTAVRDYHDAGYLPEAIINFLALLGWNPGDDRELFTLANLIEEFSLEKVQKTGAIFNEKKLQWINRAYIRDLTPQELAVKLMPFIEKTGKLISAEIVVRIARVEGTRLSQLSDVTEHISIYTEDPSTYEQELLAWKGSQDPEEIKTHLTEVRKILCDIAEDDFFNIDRLQENIGPYATEHSKGNVLWPLRVALSGQATSPGPFEIMYVIGKEATLRRIDNAIALLK